MNTPNPAGALAGAIKAKQQFIADVLTERPNKVYRLDDYKTIGGILFNNVKDAVTRRFPLFNDRYSIEVADVDYDDPEEVSITDQKDAIMNGKSCTRRLRGSWVMKDSVTDKVVSKTKRMTLMKVPYMTERGTFIRNGHEYAFTNILRLEPGVYTKDNGTEVSAQFNTKRGTGSGFNMRLIPETGIMQISKGTINCPAYTVFKDMGISDDQMKDAWGSELFEKNKAAGTGEKPMIAASKIYNN